MRILVADDDPVYRSLLRQILTEWHFDVLLANDGAQAMEVMRAPDAPDVMILDWDMPKMDGFEVARTIRSEKGDSRYILLITGSRNKEDVMQVLVSGADDYLIKPFEPMDLKVHLRTALRMVELQKELAELKESLCRQA